MDTSIRFGIARRDTTPTRPVSLAGYFNERLWDKILDRLEVRAIVLQKAEGAPLAAILQYDLVEISQDLDAEVRKALNAEFGKGSELASNFILTATHSHTAPSPDVNFPGYDPLYLPEIAKKGAEALREAASSLRTGELFCGQTADSRFLFNRRYWMKNGTVITNPGKLNPDIVRPEGDIDPEIPLAVIKCGGVPFVVIASIVNHGDTIGGNGVSADWIGACHRTVEARLPKGGMMLPLIGASGNINHFDVSTDSDQTCYAESQRIGKGYAETILKALDQPGMLQPAKSAAVQFASRNVALMTRGLFPDELKDAQDTLKELENLNLDLANGAPDLTSEDLANNAPIARKYFALQAMQQQKEAGQRCTVEIAGIRIGHLVFASLHAEPFVEIGLQLRKGIFADDLCFGIAHSFGATKPHSDGAYIPNAWNYHRGGYETTALSNPYTPDTAARLLAGWEKLAKELK